MDNFHATPNVGFEGTTAPDFSALMGMKVSTSIRAFAGRLIGSSYALNVAVMDPSGNQTNLGPATSVADDLVTIDSSPKQLPSRACKRVFVQAHTENAGDVTVGAATVVGALSGRRGKTYFAGAGDWHEVSNSNLLYGDAVNLGDKLHLYYEI